MGDGVRADVGPDLGRVRAAVPACFAPPAQAQQLHLGNANYCWFTDPSRALCLKLAGDQTADKPLIGMCDSARCPQATHHPCHRPIWAEHAENTRTFLGQFGPTRKTERARLQAEYDRSVRVLARTDGAAAAGEPG
jgi:hypothetical protein